MVKNLPDIKRLFILGDFGEGEGICNQESETITDQSNISQVFKVVDISPNLSVSRLSSDLRDTAENTRLVQQKQPKGIRGRIHPGAHPSFWTASQVWKIMISSAHIEFRWLFRIAVCNWAVAE